MSGSNSFRGLTGAQSDIVEYWRSLRPPLGLPTRGQLDPGVLRAHLSSISMIQVEEQGSLRFRFAGSGLRAALGQDVSGKRLQDLSGASVDMLSLGITAAIERQAPVGGVIERTRDRQVWLRLPFSGSDGEGLVILCHDVLVREELSQPSGRMSPGMSATRTSLAA